MDDVQTAALQAVLSRVLAAKRAALNIPVAHPADEPHMASTDTNPQGLRSSSDSKSSNDVSIQSVIITEPATAETSIAEGQSSIWNDVVDPSSSVCENNSGCPPIRGTHKSDNSRDSSASETDGRVEMSPLPRDTSPYAMMDLDIPTVYKSDNGRDSSVNEDDGHVVMSSIFPLPHDTSLYAKVGLDAIIRCSPIQNTYKSDNGRDSSASEDDGHIAMPSISPLPHNAFLYAKMDLDAIIRGPAMSISAANIVFSESSEEEGDQDLEEDEDDVKQSTRHIRSRLADSSDEEEEEEEEEEEDSDSDGGSSANHNDADDPPRSPTNPLLDINMEQFSFRDASCLDEGHKLDTTGDAAFHDAMTADSVILEATDLISTPTEAAVGMDPSSISCPQSPATPTTALALDGTGTLTPPLIQIVRELLEVRNSDQAMDDYSAPVEPGQMTKEGRRSKGKTMGSAAPESKKGEREANQNRSDSIVRRMRPAPRPHALSSVVPPSLANVPGCQSWMIKPSKTSQAKVMSDETAFTVSESREPEAPTGWAVSPVSSPVPEGELMQSPATPTTASAPGRPGTPALPLIPTQIIEEPLEVRNSDQVVEDHSVPTEPGQMKEVRGTKGKTMGLATPESRKGKREANQNHSDSIARQTRRLRSLSSLKPPFLIPGRQSRMIKSSDQAKTMPGGTVFTARKSREPGAATGWTVLPVSSPVLEGESMMVDELQSSSPGSRVGEGVNGHGRKEDPLFLHSASQPSFPYSQWTGGESQWTGVDQHDPIVNDSEGSEAGEALRRPGKPKGGGKYPRLTDLASQPAIFTPPTRAKLGAENKSKDMYGRSMREEEEESSDSESESDSEEEISHIPKGRRAG